MPNGGGFGGPGGPGGPGGGPGGGGRGGFGGGGGGRGGFGGFGGGGGRGGFGGGGDTTEHRYNMTLQVAFNNILNHTNPGGYTGLINSPQFGQATNVYTGFAGQGGGGTTANNRRIELSIRLNF